MTHFQWHFFIIQPEGISSHANCKLIKQKLVISCVTSTFFKHFTAHFFMKKPLKVVISLWNVTFNQQSDWKLCLIHVTKRTFICRVFFISFEKFSVSWLSNELLVDPTNKITHFLCLLCLYALLYGIIFVHSRNYRYSCVWWSVEGYEKP